MNVIILKSKALGNSIEVRFENNTLWLTQQLIAELFQTSVPNISMRIKSIYEDKGLEAGATLKNFLTVRQVVSGILRTFMIDYKTVHQA